MLRVSRPRLSSVWRCLEADCWLPPIMWLNSVVLSLMEALVAPSRIKVYSVNQMCGFILSFNMLRKGVSRPYLTLF
jgi:hypothetical protein